MTPSDPVAALQAGASEDEAAARNTPGDGTARWFPAVDRSDEGIAGYSVISAPGVYVASAGGLGPQDGAGVVCHMARQDPPRALAFTEAYRKILAEWERVRKFRSPYRTGYRDALLFAIEKLAGAYEDAGQTGTKAPA